MNQTFYSNGKLMIAGEYLVLHGASSLVVPLKVGQLMQVMVERNGHPVLQWDAKILGKQWFTAGISLHDWSVIQTNDENIAFKLVNILKETVRINPVLFEDHAGYQIFTETGFDQQWGFGSSATLTANIAKWAGIDPFELHFRISEGSGADVAAAISSGPVLYRLVNNKPHYCRINFAPSFMKNLWLVYTGNKQDTALSIKKFHAMTSIPPKSIEALDNITMEMTAAPSLKAFMELMSQHEIYLSDLWGVPVLKESFVDFPGEVKSLGAWGGDFIMAASESEKSLVYDYFLGKNMRVLFSLDQIILQ